MKEEKAHEPHLATAILPVAPLVYHKNSSNLFLGYNENMKMTVQEFADKFRTLRGDTTESTPDEFIIEGINWCFRDLPLVPKLGKIFSKHDKYNLDAKGHYRWKINGNFRRLIDIPMMNFYSSTGGEPCKLTLCHKDVEDFYNINGLVELKQRGTPCQYTIEEEDDNVWLVFDRPLNIPIIVDIIAYGFPKPVSSMDDEIEISAIAEHLMMMVLSTVWLQEAEDFSFAGNIYDYLDNKWVPQAVQALNKQWGVASPIILGE